MQMFERPQDMCGDSGCVFFGKMCHFHNAVHDSSSCYPATKAQQFLYVIESHSQLHNQILVLVVIIYVVQHDTVRMIHQFHRSNLRKIVSRREFIEGQVVNKRFTSRCTTLSLNFMLFLSITLIATFSPLDLRIPNLTIENDPLRARKGEQHFVKDIRLS